MPTNTVPQVQTLIAPPFTLVTALRKVRLAEDAWNSRDPKRVALAYSEDSVWRNRSEFVTGRAAICQFLTGKWDRELDYRLVKDLWAFTDDRIAALPVRMARCCRPMAPQLRQRTVGIRR
jgi:nuclear transport factor 2 (NTF2) superfamily protein